MIDKKPWLSAVPAACFSLAEITKSNIKSGREMKMENEVKYQVSIRSRDEVGVLEVLMGVLEVKMLTQVPINIVNYGIFTWGT